MATSSSDRAERPLIRKGSGKLLLITVSVMMLAVVFDTVIIRISDLILKSTSSFPLNLFTILAGISLIGQNLILRLIKRKTDESNSTAVYKNLSLNSIYKAAVIIHYILAALIVFTILQMLITSRYDVALLNVAITISYAFAIVTMMMLSHRFFSWFRLNKSLVIFLYGLSSIMLGVSAGITLWLVNDILLARPGEVMPHVMTQIPTINTNPLLNYAYIITTIISFIITWCATMALLRNYIQRTGKFRYLLVLTLPLAYFVSQFLVLSLGLFGPLIISNPIFYAILFTIIFTLSKPLGGLIFGIGFWMVARNIHKDNVVRSYLIISGYGFLLFFTSNQAIVLTFTYYPPFGLVTISFVGLASYLVLLGIYSSAISISHDANLRREIRRLALRESRLLDSIGSAQMEEEVRRRVLHITRNKSDMVETGVPSSLNEEDVHQYLDDVLKEIKTIKKKGSSANENL